MKEYNNLENFIDDRRQKVLNELENRIKDLSLKQNDFIESQNLLASIGGLEVLLGASSVINLISTILNGNPSEIVEKLGTLSKILDLLNEVLDILKDLKVQIKKEFEEFSANILRGTTDTIESQYEYWIDVLRGDDNNQIDLIKKIIIEHYTNLQINVNNVYTRGYAGYDLIALSLSYEILLSEMLGLNNDSRIRSINRYLNKFFIKAIDPTISGSI